MSELQLDPDRLARAEVPPGHADLALESAEAMRMVEAAILASFRLWGYRDVIPPSLEYLDNQTIGVGDEMVRQMIKVVDRDGRILSLRADYTSGLARMVATKLSGIASPIRVCYAGPVLRQEAATRGGARETRQAGAELYGEAGAPADAEALAMTCEVLRRLGLQDFRINLGHMGYFAGIVEGLALTPPQMADLRAALDNRNATLIEEVLRECRLPGTGKATIAALVQLPGLAGGPEVFEKGAAVFSGPRTDEALSRLYEIHEQLAAFGAADKIRFDLCDVRGFEYYTGVRFEVFAPGVGGPIVSGGRYDGLLEQFGTGMPAVGMAVMLEQLLSAQRAAGFAFPLPARRVFLQPGAAPAKLLQQVVLHMRARGVSVAWDWQSKASETQTRLVATSPTNLELYEPGKPPIAWADGQSMDVLLSPWERRR